MKKCVRCQVEKDLTLFYRHMRLPDGRLSTCKTCVNELVTARLCVDKEKARHREAYHRLKYKSNNTGPNKARWQSAYNKKFPEKHKARIVARMPISKGQEKHHWSYNDDHLKDVLILATKDHRKAHRFLVYDQGVFMYRTLSGELLDSKEKHLAYITDKIKTEQD